MAFNLACMLDLRVGELFAGLGVLDTCCSRLCPGTSSLTWWSIKHQTAADFVVKHMDFSEVAVDLLCGSAHCKQMRTSLHIIGCSAIGHMRVGILSLLLISAHLDAQCGVSMRRCFCGLVLSPM